MKIGVFADAQIGNCYTTTNPKGINQRLLDFLDSLRYAIDNMIREECKFILFAGDLFKSNQPNIWTQIQVGRIISRAINKGITVVMEIGNHDISSETFGYEPLFELYNMIDNPKIAIANRPKTLDFDDVRICCLPYPNKGILPYEDIKNLSNQEINIKLKQYVMDIMKAFQPDPSKYSILLAHLAVQEAEVRDRFELLADEIMLSKSELPQNFDAVLLGHYHKQQVLSEDPLICYIGSIDCEDFNEAKDKKKFLILDTESKKCEWRDIPGKRFMTFKLEVGKEFHMDDPKDAMIRLRVKSPKDAFKIGLTGIMTDLYKKGAQEVFVDYECYGETMLRSETIHKNMTEVELLMEWLKLQEKEIQKRESRLMAKIKEERNGS